MNKTTSLTAIAFAITLANLMGCGGEAATANPTSTVCVTDETQVCKCGEEMGMSSCVDGTEWGPCICSGIPTRPLCVPNEQKDCLCADGAEGKQVCANDAHSYSVCICPDKPDAGTDGGDAVTCGPDNRPVGYVIGSNCCDGGTTGYMVCQPSGKFEGCWGCPLDVCGPGQPAGHVLASNCCADGSTGYMACQPNGKYEGCYGCPLEQADAGTDGDAAAQPVITITREQPFSSQLDFGQSGAHLFDATVCATQDVEITKYAFDLQGLFGAVIVGSQGTKYFTNIKVVDVSSMVTLQGPKELVSGVNNMTQSLTFIDTFPVGANTCRTIAFVADISDTEDGPNELGGKTFMATQHKPEARFAGTSNTVPIEEIVLDGDQGFLLTVKSLPPVTALSATLSPASPPSGIRIAGKVFDEPFAIYTVKNTTSEPVTFDHVGIQPISADTFHGPEDISCLWAVIKGFKMSTCALDSIGVTQVGPAFNGDSVTLDPGESAELSIGASLQGVMPSSIPDYNGYKNPRSGDQLHLQMFSLFKGTHLVGIPDSTEPNDMVVRKTKPIVNQLPLYGTVLVSTDLEMFRFKVSADDAGPVGIKSFKFHVAKTGNFTIQNFRLRRGTNDIDPNSYYMLTDGTPGGSGYDMGPDMLSTNVTFIFTQEETVSGQGNVYSVHALMTGTSAGCSVTTRLTGKEDTEVVTGKIYSAYPTLISVTNSAPYTYQSFVWSDESELPHNPLMNMMSSSPVSSADWTNGFAILDLTGTATLSN